MTASTKRLTEDDFAAAAAMIGTDVASIKAVTEVEAPSGPFLEDGRPRVLFEGHIFHRLTGGRFSGSHPTISYPKWTKAHYSKGKDAEQRGVREWERLSAAIDLDRQAALKSASWGMFQIMGFNHAACGYGTVQDFVNAMYRSEGEQLKAFVRYVMANGLANELRMRMWKEFARAYNGPAYAQNQYDVKLAKAYAKYSRAA